MENFLQSPTDQPENSDADAAATSPTEQRNIRYYRERPRMNREKAIRTGVWAYAAAIAIFHTVEPALEAQHAASPVDAEAGIVQEYHQTEFTSGTGPIEFPESNDTAEAVGSHHEETQDVHLPKQQAPDGHLLDLVQRQKEEDLAQLQSSQDDASHFHLAA